MLALSEHQYRKVRVEVNVETLRRDLLGFWRAWIVTLGRRHRLFTNLHRPPSNGAVRAWRSAARALGLIAGALPGPGVASLVLNPSHPDYIAGHLMFGAIRSLDYASMDGLFQRGRGLRLLSRPRRNEAIEEATQWDHAMFLRRLPRSVRARMERGCDILELGCGTGKWLAMMRRAFPRSRFRGVDADPETGAEVGTAETAGTTAGADIIYLGEVLLVTNRRKTLANCARVLRPGGHLLILEAFMPERVSTRKWESVLFAIQLDEALQGVQFMKRSELRLPPMFERPRFTRLGGCVALAVARRRAR